MSSNRLVAVALVGFATIVLVSYDTGVTGKNSEGGKGAGHSAAQSNSSLLYSYVLYLHPTQRQRIQLIIMPTVRVTGIKSPKKGLGFFSRLFERLCDNSCTRVLEYCIFGYFVAGYRHKLILYYTLRAIPQTNLSRNYNFTNYDFALPHLIFTSTRNVWTEKNVTPIKMLLILHVLAFLSLPSFFSSFPFSLPLPPPPLRTLNYK